MVAWPWVRVVEEYSCEINVKGKIDGFELNMGH